MIRGSRDHPSLTLAAVLSVTLHGGLLALALLGTDRWQPARPQPLRPPGERISAVRYVAIGAAALQRHGEARSGSAARATRASPVARVARRFSHAPLFGITPSVTQRTSVDLPKIRAGVLKTVPARRVTPAGHDIASRESVGRGVVQGAELLRRAGAACPELRRPPGGPDPDLTVAVAFVVDTSGAVDRATLRVVEAPDRSRAAPEFFPLIYVVGMAARVDPGLPDGRAEQWSEVTDDVLRHVAGLRFRPASRNGHPVRSSVLVACQAH